MVIIMLHIVINENFAMISYQIVDKNVGGLLVPQLWEEDKITHICIQRAKWEKEVVAVIICSEGAEPA